MHKHSGPLFSQYLKYTFILFACCYATTFEEELEVGLWRSAGGVSCFRFQNEYNKVEIALRVGQSWSEIKFFILIALPLRNPILSPRV